MLIYMQKINFITHFFRKVLQRNNQFVILSDFSMSAYTPKMIVSFWRKFWCLSAVKKSFSSFMLSLGYCKDIADLLWVLGTCLATHTQSDTIKCRKLSCFSADKKSCSSSIFFWRYWKHIQTSYFWHFGHAWLRTPKMTVSTCRILQYVCQTVCQK